MENKLSQDSYNKYIGTFDMDVFGPDGVYSISGSECITLAQNIETAKMTLIYEMLHQCMFECMPVRAIKLVSVYDCMNEINEDIIKFPSQFDPVQPENTSSTEQS